MTNGIAKHNTAGSKEKLEVLKSLMYGIANSEDSATNSAIKAAESRCGSYPPVGAGCCQGQVCGY